MADSRNAPDAKTSTPDPRGNAVDPPAVDPLLPTGAWQLPSIVQTVQQRSLNGTIAFVSAEDRSDALKQGTGENINEFLSRLIELALQQPFYAHARYILYADRVDNIQFIIRNMFPSVCIPHEIRHAMAQNLAFGVTYWRWLNELLFDKCMGLFAFHGERDAQRSLVLRLEDLIDEWNVATGEYHGRKISLAGFTINTGDLCFKGLEPNIGTSKFYLQPPGTRKEIRRASC
jgi:hypothetical protein